MSKKKVIIAAIIVVETILLFITFTEYMHMKNLVQECLEVNQELLDAYTKHNERFHCDITPYSEQL